MFTRAILPFSVVFLIAGGEPTKGGYTMTFSICAAVLLVGVLASLAVPGRRRRLARSVELVDLDSATDSRIAA